MGSSIEAPKRSSLTLERTVTPGIYRRHSASCTRKGKCGCPYVVITRRRGKQTKSFHRTLELAREAKADRTRTDRQAPQSRRAFDEYAREWVRTCQGRTTRGFDEDTRASYSAILEAHAIPHFGSSPLRDISRKDVRALVTKLQHQGLAAATVARYVAPVRSLFSDAVDDGELPVNPALRLTINAKAGKNGQGVQTREKTLTRTELSMLLTAIPDQFRLAFEVMAGTGCRISELLGLEWRDLDAAEATLRIERQWYRTTLKPNTKTEAGKRTLRLSPELATKLSERRPELGGPMFHSRTGHRLNDRNLRRVLDRAAAKHQLDGVGFHTFRHTHGSMLLDQGWSIADVADRLGHANPAITAEVYSHRMRDRDHDLSFIDLVIITREG